MTHNLNTVSKLLCVLGISFSLSACIIVDTTSDRSKSRQSSQSPAIEMSSAAASNSLALTNTAPKNIIMVVADGMGPAYVSAYRYFNDNPNTPHIETTIFDDILVGSIRTYPHEQSGLVTDSAASATAMAAGIKTYNGAIGMGVDKVPVETVLHRAHKHGMKTGLAATSHIVHATPASYMVANELRRNYAEIADSFYDDRINGEHLADIMLGAGWGHFIRDDRNVVDEFVADGYQYIDKYAQLSDINPAVPVLGLFGDNSLPWALDDAEPLRLTKLTEAIVPYLASADSGNDNGYFLLLEASQVDWAGHGNDIASAMAEMHDLAKTIEFLYDYVEKNPDTLVVLTADHSTGGMAIGAKGDYRWEPQYLKGFKASVTTIAMNINEQADKAQYAQEMFGFALDDDDIAAINAINPDMEPRPIEAVLKKVIDKRTNTGWTTSGHTGEDVQVFAFGPGAARFEGNLNNTDIAHKIFDLLDEAH
jgi:alkaline phosphatase